MADTRRSLSALQALYADNTSGDISAQDGRDELVSSHPTNVIQTGTLADIPAAGQLQGDLYLPNNAPYLYRYSGSAWGAFGPLWPMTPVVDADYSWVNQGTATVSVTNGVASLTFPAQAADNIRARVRSTPATPYTISVYLSVGFPASTSFYMSGLVWRESGTGELLLIGPSVDGTQVQFRGYKAASPTAVPSIQAMTIPNPAPAQMNPFWMRLSDDGTDRKVWWSPDGFLWVELFSELRTTFLTPDQVGFGAYVSNATLGSQLSIFSVVVA